MARTTTDLVALGEEELLSGDWAGEREAFQAAVDSEGTPDAFEVKGEPGSLVFLPKGVPHALKFGEKSSGRWLWISPQNRDELFREAGVPAIQPEPKEEDLDMERIFGVFEKNGMRFLEQGH